MHRIPSPPAERTAWIVDETWPEFASMAAASFGPDDQLLAPGFFGPRPPRYAWPVAGAQHPAGFATLLRHLAMRRTARADPATRQLTWLHHDRKLAHRLATAVDWRARHLVVAQGFLPWLDEAGVLGGRSYDVLMKRYPLGEAHRLLDRAAAEFGPSPTIADYRADPALVAHEAELLARARRIVTPHHGVAAMFPEQAWLLAWHRPAPAPRRPGNRVAFLGPTMARKRPDVARRLAEGLGEPLIIFGRNFEPGDIWRGLPVEHREKGPGWLDEVGAILHPAAMTTEPRHLLSAIASGITVYTNAEAGLESKDYLPLEQFVSR